MTVDFAYQIVQYAVNKAQNGYVSPSDFNLAINNAQNEFMNWLLGPFQQYQPGRPAANVELGQNQVVRQRLTPVIYGYILTVDPSGFSPKPGDYQQADAMWTMDLKRIRTVDQDKLWAVYGSVIDPYATNPFYTIEATGFTFYPASIGQARLSYVRNPPQIVWGYTLDPDGIPIYNPGTSTDPVWNDVSMMEILARTLRLVGVNLQANDVNAYSTEVKRIGQ